MFQPSGLRVARLSDDTMMLAYPPTDRTAEIAAAGTIPLPELPGNEQCATALVPFAPAVS